MILPFICFLVCHVGPAGHFLEFANYLKSQGYRVEILATGTALAKLKEAASEFNPQDSPLDAALAQEVAEKCRKYDLVITDMGHCFMKDLHQRLQVSHYAYYDNPEAWVPGGYSEVAASIAEVADALLFANIHLAEKPLFEGKKSYGIGYYPFQHAQRIRKKREAREAKEEGQQKIVVYFGGNNEEYYTRGFPQFLELLSAVELPTLILQQHPGAKRCNIDRKEVEKSCYSFPFLISEKSSDEMLLLTDVALYFQTSMNIEFLAIGIPHVVQVGSLAAPDILVKSGLVKSVATPEEFQSALKEKVKVDQKSLEKVVGYSSHWPELLKEALLMR